MQWKSSSSGTRILLGSQSRNQTQVPPDPAMDQLCDSEQGLTLSGPPWPHRDCLLRILSTQSKHMWPPHTEGSAGLRCCRGNSPGGRGWEPGASVIGQSREGSGTLAHYSEHTWNCISFWSKAAGSQPCPGRGSNVPVTPTL